MRGPGILMALALLMATPASAEEQENTRAACSDHRDNDGDGHVDCDDQDCQDLVLCAATLPRAVAAPAADETAKLRGRGVTRVVVGSVLLSLGVVLGGTSSALWVAGADHYGFNAYQQGGVAMDAVGVAMIAVGTTFLAIGAGNLAEARRPRLALSPTSASVRF